MEKNSRFRNNVSSGWLFAQALIAFRNFIKNYNGNISQSDFFDMFDNVDNLPEMRRLAVKHFKLEKLINAKVVELQNGCVTFCEEDHSCVLQKIWNKKGLRKNCKAMLLEWCDRLERRNAVKCRGKDRGKERVDEVCRVLKLNNIEREILVYSLVRATSGFFDDLPKWDYKCNRDERMLFCAMAIDRPLSTVVKAMGTGGKLRTFGVLDSCVNLNDGAFREYLENGEGDMLEGRFYRKAQTEDALPWNYYGKLVKEHGDILRDMILSAKFGKRGVNILLYGEPGTGKTSFVKTLAKELGLDLFEILHGNRDGGENSPQSRAAGIRICNTQVPRERSMILVDEADRLLRTNMDLLENLFAGNGSGASEKGMINWILDETRLPTVWVSNVRAEELDDSVRRRFDYSIRFDKIGDLQRTAIWRNNIAKFGLGKIISEECAERFASRYRTNAGAIAMVLENVKRMHPGKDRVVALVDSLMKPHCELMAAECKTEDAALRPAGDYSLEGLNIKGDIALEQVVAAVKNFRCGMNQEADPDRPRMNILLWGPPGTGKTEFVKHLGRAVGGKVAVKMGSDLLSRWVGGTESNIRQAFAEAEADNAVLFLDEIDGLVQDRSGAQHGWEVSQVNELLHRMENFKGVMVGATNFMDNLDAAIMRRFTFKFQFDYLDEKGKRLFFERMFKTRLSGAEAERLAGIPCLAPGDFRTVRQSFYYLGCDVTNAMRLDGLEKESALKKKSPRRIGF
jgi:SpoVK/Ycf46/Vps4 family AAA+-type ATPase